MSAACAWLKGLLGAWADTMDAHKQELIALDGLCGDSDLGLTMSAGFLAAANAASADPGQDCGMLLYQAGKAMASAVPSTMGTLMASGLMEAGKALKGTQALDDAGQLTLFDAFYQGVQKRGKAQPGEKTFLDGLGPAVDSLRQSLDSGLGLPEAAARAAECGQRGYEGTRGVLARHGRMAIRGEASREYLDPGARVAALLTRTWADYLKAGA